MLLATINFRAKFTKIATGPKQRFEIAPYLLDHPKDKSNSRFRVAVINFPKNANKRLREMGNPKLQKELDDLRNKVQNKVPSISKVMTWSQEYVKVEIR